MNIKKHQKKLVLCLWLMSCLLMYRAGMHAVSQGNAVRSPASIKSQVIGQQLRITVGEHQELSFDAKVDTGAESSSLHAENVKLEWKWQRAKKVAFVTYDLLDHQGKKHRFFKRVSRIDDVKNANGVTIRYYVMEKLRFEGNEIEAEVSLSDRSDLKFKFLLGKNALRQINAVVDPKKDVILYDNMIPPRYVYKQP